MLSFTTFKERSVYWSELLPLLWLRSIGHRTAFCVVLQATKQSKKKREFSYFLDLDAYSIESNYFFEILTITCEEMENYFKHFRSFLLSLNKKQFKAFFNDNQWYNSVIMQAVSCSSSLTSLIAELL